MRRSFKATICKSGNPVLNWEFHHSALRWGSDEREREGGGEGSVCVWEREREGGGGTLR